MLVSPIRYCGHVGLSMKHMNSILAATNTKFVFGCRSYAKDGKGSNRSSCCKDIVQSEGRKVEPWPKSDPPPPAWRCQCPQDPQPVNYDPYRIKVPDVAVPPLPPSNCKWRGGVLSTGMQGQDYQSPKPQQGPCCPQTDCQEEEREEGLMGMLKGLFDKIRGKSKDDNRDSFLLPVERDP